MQLELVLSNEPRALASMRAFARETLRQLPLSPADAGELEKLAFGAVDDAIEHAYRDGEEGAIKLAIREQHGRLEIVVRDFGMPQDVESLERRLHEGGAGGRSLFGCPAELLDEVHWLAFGPEGKALQVRKWLGDKSIADSADSAVIEPFEEDAPLAPPSSTMSAACCPPRRCRSRS